MVVVNFRMKRWRYKSDNIIFSHKHLTFSRYCFIRMFGEKKSVPHTFVPDVLLLFFSQKSFALTHNEATTRTS